MLMENFYNDHKYLLSLNISQCYEPDSCGVQQVVLKNSVIPKDVCDWSMDYLIKGLYYYQKM